MDACRDNKSKENVCNELKVDPSVQVQLAELFIEARDNLVIKVDLVRASPSTLSKTLS